MCLEHYDGKKEWIDPRDYQAVKQVEMSYAQSVKNMADHTKVGLYDIMLMTSFNPAHYIHADDCKGSIRPGMDADLTIMDQNLDLICVYCRGKEIRE